MTYRAGSRVRPPEPAPSTGSGRWSSSTSSARPRTALRRSDGGWGSWRSS